jgi:hypothetical protein
VRRVVAAGALMVLSAACGGPQQPVSIGFKEVPSDVVLGAQSSPTPAPTGATPAVVTVVPPPPAVVALPPPTFDAGPATPLPVPTATTATCATADPLQAPAREAPPSIATPPAKAAYLFANVGSYEVSGADARKGRFPTTSLRTVANISRTSAGSFSFDVADLLGDVTTTTTYDVISSSPLPAGVAPGLYVRQVKSVRGTSSSVFAPSPELQLAAFPLVRGASITSSGVDPQSATSMQFTSTVTGKARVDACGTPLDSWVLDLTAGKVLSPTQNLDFTATYDVGTEYGGLILRDRTVFTGTDNGDGVSRNNTASITTTPKVP